MKIKQRPKLYGIKAWYQTTAKKELETVIQLKARDLAEAMAFHSCVKIYLYYKQHTMSQNQVRHGWPESLLFASKLTLINWGCHSVTSS